MDHLLSQTEDDLGLNDYFSSPPSSVLSTSPTDEEMNYLLGIKPSLDPVPSTSTAAPQGACPVEIEEKNQKN